MAINTTDRLVLQKPDPEEPIANGDNILSSNYDIIDLNTAQRIVTNTADIVTPYEGESIYATAPAHNYVRKGGAWVQVDGAAAPSGGARGNKGTAGDSVEKDYSTGLTDILIYSITFTAEINRRYLIQYNFNAIRGFTSPPSGTNYSNGFIDANFRWNAGATVNNSHTQIGERKEYRVFSAHSSLGFDLVSTGYDLNGFIEFFPNISGQVTVGLFTQIDASTAWKVNYFDDYQSSFHIMDWDN